MGSSLQCTIFKGCSYEPSLVYISSLNQRHTLPWFYDIARSADCMKEIQQFLHISCWKHDVILSFLRYFFTLFKGTVEWNGFFNMQSDQGWRYYFRLVRLNSKLIYCRDILYFWRHIHVDLQKRRNVFHLVPTKIHMKNLIFLTCMLLLEYAQ